MARGQPRLRPTLLANMDTPPPPGRDRALSPGRHGGLFGARLKALHFFSEGVASQEKIEVEKIEGGNEGH